VEGEKATISILRGGRTVTVVAAHPVRAAKLSGETRARATPPPSRGRVNASVLSVFDAAERRGDGIGSAKFKKCSGTCTPGRRLIKARTS